MKKVDIVDSAIAHIDCSCGPWQTNENFYWNRNPQLFDGQIIFLTDHSLGYIDQLMNIQKRIAWLLEPRAIQPQTYEWIKQNYHKFTHVLTYDKELLELSDIFVHFPFGGSWIKKADMALYEKTKDVSIITSLKNWTEGHRVRLASMELINEADRFLPKDKGTNQANYVYKLFGLKDYRYSITVENCKMDYYFTEKLIDCMVTGTIPIYYGCPSIDTYFNEKGIIQFDTIEELSDILKNIGEKEYKDRYNYVKENYELAKEYLLCEDRIFTQYI